MSAAPLSQIRLSRTQRMALEDANAWGLTPVRAGFAMASGPRAARSHYHRASYTIRPVSRLRDLGLLEAFITAGGKPVWKPTAEGLFMLQLAPAGVSSTSTKGAR